MMIKIIVNHVEGHKLWDFTVSSKALKIIGILCKLGNRGGNYHGCHGHPPRHLESHFRSWHPSAWDFLESNALHHCLVLVITLWLCQNSY